MALALLSVPHAGEHAVLPCVSVHVTAVLEVFVTVAVNCCVPFTVTEGVGGATETEIGGAAVTVIVAEAALVESVTEVAVIVTVGLAGTVAGAV